MTSFATILSTLCGNAYANDSETEILMHRAMELFSAAFTATIIVAVPGAKALLERAGR